MLLHLHPTRPEALTVNTVTLTRWSLENRVGIQVANYTPANCELLRPMFMLDGREAHYGGVTGAPDGLTFAMERPNPHVYRYQDPCVLELRRWDDLSPVRTITLPDSACWLESLDISPDGRWLVVAAAERIFLVDLHTGNVSHVIYGSTFTSGLTFDPTSTVVGGVRSTDGGGSLRLWRLVPTERYSPRPLEDWERLVAPPDHVSGAAALFDMYGKLDRTGIGRHDLDIADAEGTVAFTPDGRMVIFSIRSAYSRGVLDVSAYEVASGRRLWVTQGNEDFSSRFALTPDGHQLIGPTWGGDLLVYRTDDGALERRLASGLADPVRALAFDHDGATLWLATEHLLVPYQPPQ